MNITFADTFFWIALTNTQDEAHAKAKQFAQVALFGTVCTTQEVLTEYLNCFAGWGSILRQKSSFNARDISRNPNVQVEPQTSDSFQNGLKLYRARPDKGYNLTDCISMETMRRKGITEVLTNDAHFSQEGFHAIFRH